MKASVFEDWSEEELLKKLPKDHVIIMDNAAFHKKEVLQNLAGKYSQTLIFLLPYSPEYNPIEHKRSALKRKVACCVHLYDSVSLVWMLFYKTINDNSKTGDFLIEPERIFKCFHDSEIQKSDFFY